MGQPHAITLSYYPSATHAIQIALRLPAYEAQDFLRDWHDHKDLAPWYLASEYDLAVAAGTQEPNNDAEIITSL